MDPSDQQAEQGDADQQEELGGGLIVQAEPVPPDRLGDERARRERRAVRSGPAAPPPPRPPREPGYRAADQRARQPEGAEGASDGHLDRGGGDVVDGDHDGAGRQPRRQCQASSGRQRAGREAAKQPGAGRVHQCAPRRAEMRLHERGGGTDRNADQGGCRDRPGGGGQHLANVADPAEHSLSRRSLRRVRGGTGFTDSDQPIGRRRPVTSRDPLRARGGERVSRATVGAGP